MYFMGESNREQFTNDHLLALTIIDGVLKGDAQIINQIRASYSAADMINGLTLVASTLTKTLASIEGLTDEEMVQELRMRVLRNTIKNEEE